MMVVVVHLVLPVEEFVVEGKESRRLREVRRRVAAAVGRRRGVAAAPFNERHSQFRISLVEHWLGSIFVEMPSGVMS